MSVNMRSIVAVGRYAHKMVITAACSHYAWDVDHDVDAISLLLHSPASLHIYVYVRQPAARGHRAFTDLSAARVWGR